jgi:hypothetical protein
VSYDPLPQPLDPPAVIPSPTSVMWRQHGNCVDLSVLLCSLLEGTGYDALCVVGYADRDTCLGIIKGVMDADVTSDTPTAPTAPSGLQLPLGTSASMAAVIEPPPPASAAKANKYAFKPVASLVSTFDSEQARRVEAAAAEQRELIQTHASLQLRRTQQGLDTETGADPLFGLRVHCWVLVRAGKRGVPASFFIEPTTGATVSLAAPQFVVLSA